MLDAKIVSFDYILKNVHNSQCILSMCIPEIDRYNIDIMDIKNHLIKKAEKELRDNDELYFCKMNYAGFCGTEIYKLYRAN